jgi:hypothetical protein
MLPAHLGKELAGRSGTSRFYVFVTLADAFRSLLEVLALPLQISGQSLVEGGGRVLTMSLSVLL